MVKRVARNTLFLSVSQLVARGIGFVYFVFLARRLGVVTFGAYTFTLAFIYNFIPVADFGLERLVLRDIPRNPKKVSFYLSRLLPLRLLLAVGAYLGVLFLGFLLGQTRQQIFYLAIFGLALVPRNFVFLVTAFLNAWEKMEYMAAANIGVIAITALLGSAFVIAQFSLGWVLTAYFLANLVLGVIFWRQLSSWGLSVGWVVDKKFWRQALGQSWVFAALLILAVFYLRLSLVLVGLLKGSYLTGVYGSAFKFVEAGILIPQSLALALFPLSSRLFVSHKQRLKRVYQKGVLVLFLGGLGAGVVMAFGARWIIPFVYGPDYLQAVPVFSILGLAMVLFFINSLPGNIIQNSPWVKQFLPWAFLNFLIKAGLCLFLIFQYSIVGAAWAVVGGEIAGLIINNWFVYKILRYK